MNEFNTQFKYTQTIDLLFLIIIDAKVLNKSQQAEYKHYKGDQAGFILEIKGWFQV